MNDPSQWRVAQLLCSKLCHDLISPVGALRNGLELLREDPGILQEAMELLDASTNQASSRLGFYRVAFGGTGVDQPMRMDEIRILIDGLLAAGRAELDGSSGSASPDEVPRQLGKLVMNLVLVAADSLPRGGTIAFDLVDGGVTVNAEGRGARLTDGAAAALTVDQPAEDIDVTVVVPYLSRGLASQLGLALSIDDSDDDHLAITATKSA